MAAKENKPWYYPRLAEHRDELFLTQQGLADATRKVCPEDRGVSKETISRIERNKGVTWRSVLLVFSTVAQRYGVKLAREDELTETVPKG